MSGTRRMCRKCQENFILLKGRFHKKKSMKKSGDSQNRGWVDKSPDFFVDFFGETFP